MDDIVFRWGESVPIQIEITDDTADSATLIIKAEDGSITELGPVDFVDGVADLSLSTTESEQFEVGDYKYQINVQYDATTLEKYPDPRTCDTCEFPDFIVKTALDAPEES